MQKLDYSSILDKIKSRVYYFPDETVDKLLTGLYVNRIGIAIIKNAGITLLSTKNNQLSDKQLGQIVNTIMDFKVFVLGKKSFDYSQVTAGGLLCSQFNPLTMESKNIKGIYCIGEVLDVDGDCGGYNLLFAFKTGYNAGVAAAKSLIFNN